MIHETLRREIMSYIIFYVLGELKQKKTELNIRSGTM